MKPPKVFTTIEAYQTWRNSIPPTETLGFVPTMGALHAGHTKLLETSKHHHPHTVLSIFVNPTQFGPHEDLTKYPRTLESDLKRATEAGVSAIFLPSEAVLYPEGYSTYVVEEKMSVPLCGVYRPGHFKGVATVVLKLLNIIEPTVAYFGLKDAQQFFVIKQMVKDLNLKTRVTGVPTVREPTGLALSSRNIYLSAEDQINRAPHLYQTLHHAKKEILKGIAPSSVIKEAQENLKSHGFEVQYFELRQIAHLADASESSQPIATYATQPSAEPAWILACAAFLPSSEKGKVRLIDNIIF